MSDTDFENILTQLVTGPSMREVACKALRSALSTLYPALNIDPSKAVIVTPIWNVADGQVSSGNNHFESLTDALVRLSLSAQTATWIDAEHYLTLQPGANSAIQLPVKISAIGRLINQLSLLFFVALQEQYVDYWNEMTENAVPRWLKLSDNLRKLWHIKQMPDWDEDQKAMALAFFNNPEQTSRHNTDKYQYKACLIDIDNSQGHQWVLDVAVLVGTVDGRTLVISRSIAEGFKQHDSLESFGKTLPDRFSSSPGSNAVRWRLYEPTGNFFDHQACALIALEIQAIGQLYGAIAPEDYQPPINTAAVHRKGLPTGQYDQIRSFLPEWINDAQPADLTRYSRHLMDLALLREKHAGKSYLDDIPALRVFTLNTLRDRVVKDHPETEDPKLENIELSITSLVVIGTFTVPGKTETVTMSLVDLALQNLIAVPLGNKTVRRTDNGVVEAWMTPAYLQQLVTDVDIGEVYPALIKRKLFADTLETQRRQELFASQLRIQLPLQALQYKIRGESGIDDLGYQYVVAAMHEKATDRYVSDLEIIIRPLAFIPESHTDDKADAVANMFVIGPKFVDKGPCLLFRPLLEPALLQYPCEANLLYAIKHSQTLRQSVLAWLPDDVRFNYSQYVFPGRLPSAWTLSQWLVDSTSVLRMMGEVTLSKTPLVEPCLSTLFADNANAMITLADRQSVSNAQSRWETLKHGAWALFNIALPFLGRTAETATWIWQIIDDLDVANKASEKGDSENTWTALTDLFLAVAMVLAHRAATRHAGAARALENDSALLDKEPTVLEQEQENTEEKLVTTAPPKITLTQMPDIAAQQLPESHKTSLYTSGPLARKGLEAFLEGMAITKPQGLPAPSTEVGLHQFLSALNQKWYAQVGQRWFEVTLNESDFVQIINTRDSPAKTGPLLMHSSNGAWEVDIRLRLRGGGRSRKEVMQENARRIIELKQQLTSFDANKETLKTALENAEKAAATSTPGVDDPQNRMLIETLDRQLDIYGVYINQLKAFNALEPIVNYREVMVSCLEAQLWRTKKWCDQQNRVFGNYLRRSIALLDNEPVEHTQTPRQTHQQTSELAQGMIDKIEFGQARIEELKRLGKNAALIASEYTATQPSFDLHDLKLFQISLAQELCLNDSGTAATGGARETLAALVEDVGLTIQSSLDLDREGHTVALTEQIEGFSDFVEQFATLDQRILDLPGEYPGQLLQPALDLMRARVEVFNERAIDHLAGLLQERRTLEPVPGPSQPKKAQLRVIKTRFKGTVIGTSRTRLKSTDTELVDVTSALTGMVIATFHEKTPGSWVEHVRPNTTLPSARHPTLAVSVQNGKTLLTQLEPFTRQTEAHSKNIRRIPLEIEEMFHQQANRMEAAAAAIEQALTDMNATESGPGSAADVTKKLSNGAVELYKKGSELRITMTKRQPPTAGRLEWLHSKGLVKIERIVKSGTAHQRLKGQRKDFMDEYQISDKATSEVLWYAHFHYPTSDTPRSAFTAAHLKTVEQRLSGGAFVTRNTVGPLQSIAIYRAEISHRLADLLFLK